MASFDVAIAGHFAALFAQRGISAVVARGASTCSADVLLAEGEQIAPEGGNFKVEQDARDLIIAAAAYKPGGTAVQPAVNDRITATVGSTATEWKVVVRGPDKQTHSRMDPKGTYLRVFCVEV